MTRTIERILEKLAEETGYDFNFLYEKFYECCENNFDTDYFLYMTKNHKWPK